MTMAKSVPAVGIGYRAAIDGWTRSHLSRFDVLEITVEHCLYRNSSKRAAVFDLVDRIPLTAHGIGLSIGTDVPLDFAHLDEVAAIVDRLKAPAFSEHLAFTRVPGRELGNLLPLPRTEAVAEAVIKKVRAIQSRLSVPFLLENISCLFQWSDSTLSDAEFLSLVCGETGSGLLLDLENLYLNALNYNFDAFEYLDALPLGLVQEVHVAGGETIVDELLTRGPFFADSHSSPVPQKVFCLLRHLLARQTPSTIILERDERLDAFDEILEDVARIRANVARAKLGAINDTFSVEPTRAFTQLFDEQRRHLR